MTKGLELFSSEVLSTKGLIPELHGLILNEDPLCLEGIIPLFDDQNCLVDTYKIRIVPTKNYPDKFPLVYEIGGRIPNNIDWHIFPGGHFCIKAQPEEMLICSRGITLKSFVQEQIVPFLFNQKFREQNGYFLNERSHGSEGNLEFFEDVFRTKNLFKIKKLLKFISEKKKPNRVSMCFCDSGIKYRKCHRDAYQLLNTLPDSYFSLWLDVL